MAPVWAVCKRRAAFCHHESVTSNALGLRAVCKLGLCSYSELLRACATLAGCAACTASATAAGLPVLSSVVLLPCWAVRGRWAIGWRWWAGYLVVGWGRGAPWRSQGAACDSSAAAVQNGKAGGQPQQLPSQALPALHCSAAVTSRTPEPRVSGLSAKAATAACGTLDHLVTLLSHHDQSTPAQHHAPAHGPT